MKAIDIVLLPEDNILHNCLAIHRQSQKEGNTPLMLSKEGYRPHLSLVMGKTHDTTIERIITILQQFSDITIPITGTHMDDSWLVVDRTPALMDLHTQLMDVIYPLLDHTTLANQEMFFEHQKTTVDPGVYPWIDNFKSSAYDKYNPHITLGAVSQSPVELPLTGTVTHLALFHLSNYNTCKQLLWENK